MHIQPINIKWLILLATGIITSVWGTVIPANMSHTAAPRQHHGAKLFNECLAKHQFGYMPFFFTLIMAADFQPGVTVYIRYLIGTLLFFGFGTYYIGIYIITRQDRLITENHLCTNPCPYRLRPGEAIRLCWVNSVFSVVLLISAILVALLTK